MAASGARNVFPRLSSAAVVVSPFTAIYLSTELKNGLANFLIQHL
jgi:hypothetical protein